MPIDLLAARTLFLLSALLATPLAGCTNPGAPKEPTATAPPPVESSAAPIAPATATAGSPPAAPSTVRADSSANGKTLEAKVGDAVELTLVENPSTGYAWKPTKQPDAAVLKLESSDYQPGAPSPAGAPPTVGKPGARLWRLRAVGAGAATLSLDLMPPGSPKPAETFTVTVHVAG